MMQIPEERRKDVGIILRESMVKVRRDKVQSYADGPCSLEIVRTSHPSKKQVNLSKTLCHLLEHGGVPTQVFLDLTEKAVHDTIGMVTRRAAARRVLLDEASRTVNKNAKSTLPWLMLESGVRMDDLYLKEQLRARQQCRYKNVSAGKVPIPNTFCLLGVADPIGVLEEDEVMVLNRKQRKCGNCLVYAHPARLLSSIRPLRAVVNADVLAVLHEDASDCIIFSTKGARAITDLMGGADMDGDIFWVTFNTDMVDNFNGDELLSPGGKDQGPSQLVVAKPIEALPVPKSLSERNEEVIRVSTRVRCVARTQLVEISHLMMAWLDEEGPLDPRYIQLTDLYKQQLDSPKTGIEVVIDKSLKRTWWPHHMEFDLNRRGSKLPLHQSESVLGQIFDVVKHPLLTHPEKVVRIDSDLLLTQDPRWMPLVHETDRQLEGHVQQLRNAQLLSSKMEAVEAARGIRRAFRRNVFAGGVNYGGNFIGEAEVRASACYYACYRRAEKEISAASSHYSGDSIDELDATNDTRALISLAWEVGGRFLCDLKARMIGWKRAAPEMREDDWQQPLKRRRVDSSVSDLQPMANEACAMATPASLQLCLISRSEYPARVSPSHSPEPFREPRTPPHSLVPHSPRFITQGSPLVGPPIAPRSNRIINPRISSYQVCHLLPLRAHVSAHGDLILAMPSSLCRQKNLSLPFASSYHQVPSSTARLVITHEAEGLRLFNGPAALAGNRRPAHGTPPCQEVWVTQGMSPRHNAATRPEFVTNYPREDFHVPAASRWARALSLDRPETRVSPEPYDVLEDLRRLFPSSLCQGTS
eukprot:TRINITY_DN2120_c0_g1_i3.p1 TRINITY_DN2120_c0_g1~~TRINITY_DN2120_c0_g1_i3.p1  ORF type:complete len:813 (+),score=94.38 TRINITY_DN2120_c0_g1_i3:188-2626(+)